MDYRHMTAPCGIDYFNCPVYLAGENEKLRKAVVAKHMNLTYEQAICQGCRGEKGVPPAYSRKGR